MPPEGNHLKEIISTLAEAGINFIICGGVAMVLHGVERMTMDLDLAVDLAEENLNKFILAMKKLNLVPRAPVPAEMLLDPETRRSLVKDKNALVFSFIDHDNPYRQVDIFLTDDLAYEALKSDIQKVRIGQSQANLISKEKLLQLKKAVRPSRDKDIFDIQALEKLIRSEKEEK